MDSPSFPVVLAGNTASGNLAEALLQVGHGVGR